MALSEIEKLERRYAENPQGLTFAPLAEVHRKNGEVHRALDLLGPGLQLHPNYIPASIVLGRCHLDLGDVHTAEKAFLHVLALDGENVIALKALADISERLLKLEDAERWLRTLLSVDRSNHEAQEQLQRVEVTRRQAGVASSAQPDSEAEPSTPDEDAAAAATTAGDAVPELARTFEPPRAEPAVGWVSQSSEISDLRSPAVEELESSTMRGRFEEPSGIQFQEPTSYDQEVQPIEGLVGREVDEPDVIPSDFRLETSEDIVLESSGGSEFQMPDASQELSADGSMAQRPPFEEDAPVPPPVVESPPPPEFVGWNGQDEDPARESLFEPALEVDVPEPEPTEPEPAIAGPGTVPVDHYPAPEPVAEAPSPPPPVAVPKRAYVASETGGRPVAQLLKSILSARPPAQAAPPPVRQAPPDSGSGAPTRPAADALSLSSVFGEEEAPGTPPAVPAAGSGTGVSFDDFFGASGATPTQRGTRSPDSKNDDLDQFHAWLQNLKR